MATSTTALIRASIVTWAEGLALELSKTVNAAPPEPGTKIEGATFSAFFPNSTIGKFEPRSAAVGGITHTTLGECEADVSLRWRLKSGADAEAVHALFVWAAMQTRDDHTMAIPLSVTIGTATYTGKLYLTGERQFADPDMTEIRDLWVVSHGARLVYPEVYVDGDVGLMAITVAVGGVTTYLSSGIDAVGATWDD